MNSKEALNNFMKTLCEYEKDTNNKESVYPHWFRVIQQDLDQLENLKKDLQYMQDKGVQQFIFPNGTIILGFDITNSPYQKEIRKEILEDTINNMLEVVKGVD